MKNHFTFNRKLLFSGVLVLAMSSAYADSACEAEVVALQPEVDAPTAEVSAADLAQAQQMFTVLSEDCDGGSTLDNVSPFADYIRSLLGMGERS